MTQHREASPAGPDTTGTATSAAGAWPQAAGDAAERPTSALRSLPRLAAVALGCTALAMAMAFAARPWLQTLGASAAPSTAGTAAPAHVQATPAPVHTAVTARLPHDNAAPAAGIPPTRVPLQAVLQVAGQSQALAGDRVALPSGARFDLQLSTPSAGRLEVYAISPAGGAPTLLWATTARAHDALRTPMMRLEGERGVERLRVLLRGERGQVLGLREIRIWHV